MSCVLRTREEFRFLGAEKALGALKEASEPELGLTRYRDLVERKGR
jgi:hypothetical protein